MSKLVSIFLLILLFCSAYGSFTPCSQLTNINDQTIKIDPTQGKSEFHMFRKYFITRSSSADQDSNPFSETVWTIEVDKDMLMRMRVSSPNTNFKISLTTESGDILADASSILGFGASISQVISRDKTSRALIKFHFYDFLKTPEEIIEHEDKHDCHLPHIVLELSVMSKETFKERKQTYLDSLGPDATITFPDLDTGYLGYGDDDNEQSLKMSNPDNLYSLSKTDSETRGKFQILKEYHFDLSSDNEKKKNKEAEDLLYYLQLQLTYDFMTSGSLHVVVVHEKDDKDILIQKDALFKYDTLNCAEEMVCVVSQKTSKNEETLNIALTEGSYGIYFIDYQNEGMRNFIADTVPKIPFSSVIYLYPMESQDNSVYCDGLSIPNPYYVPYVLSDKSIFDEKIEVNLRNTTQDIHFQVETTNSAYMRVTTEQDIGVDVDIRVFDSSNNELGSAKEIGATETTVVKVQSSGKYKIQLSYRNSIIRDLQSCPQLHLYVSTISEANAKEIGKKQDSLLDGGNNSFSQIEDVLGKMQSAMDNGDTYTNDDSFDVMYVFPRESYTSIEENIYQNKLTNNKNKAYWVYFEIFCDEVFNDVVVNIDYEDKRFTRTSDLQEKLSSGETDQILRSQKALHVFSMVMSYKDTYNIEFLARNVLGNVVGFDEQLKHVMFQMKVQINPIVKNNFPLTMTSLLPKTFNNLRDLGVASLKYSDINFLRERVLLNTRETNKITFTISKDSRVRVYLKSLISGVSIKSVIVTDSNGSKVIPYIIEKTFMETDLGFTLKNQGTYTLNIEARAKNKKFGDFFMKLEIETRLSRKQCDTEIIPKFNDIAIVAKRSDSTQETHYYIGNQMFRNVYHLGQRQIGTPHNAFFVNLPGNDAKNYAVIPFTLEAAANLVTVNLFHDWAEDFVKIYIISKDEDPKDLFDIIREQKKNGDHSNIPEMEEIFQSKTLGYYDGIEKQFLARGDYKLVIMNMDVNTDGSSKACMGFTMSVYVEEQLKKRESKDKSGVLITSYDQVDDSLDESIIESMTLCQYTFVFNEMFRNPIKVNGGVLSIDSLFRFDNDERSKRVELEVDTNSVIYVKVTDIYNQIQELELSLDVVLPNKDMSMQDITKVVTSKRADKASKKFFEKFVEIQQFVKKGKYLIDLSKSVFEIDTDLFPCTRIRVEIEVRPLSDIPDVLRDPETCGGDKGTASRMTVVSDTDSFGKVNKVESFFPITRNVSKKFKFKISEPTFLSFMVEFEKEISGGSMSITISHVPNMKGSFTENKKNGKDMNLPVSFSSDTSDGISFIHERLEPYISGDMRVDKPGEYIVSITGGHKAELSKTLKANKFIPECSRVVSSYQLIKISDIENTFNEEFAADTGSIDADNDNCKNISIDNISDLQKYIERQRTSNYLDASAKILIPDPTSKKRITFTMRSASKPVLSVVKITASLPEEIRTVSNLKFHIKAVEVKSRKETDLSMQNSIRAHEHDISFLIDDTETRSYLISIDFEEVDFELLQTHCSFIELRVVREPAFNIMATLASFDKSSKYIDVSSLNSNPKTVTIDKEKSVKLPFYLTKDAIKSKKSTVLGKIKIDVRLDQVQLDILAEYNYISTQVHLELVGAEEFSDHGVFEISDEHYNSNQIYTARNAIRLIGTGDAIERGVYTLIIKGDPYSKKLIKNLEENDIDVMDDLIFPFTIKIESSPVRSDLKPTDEKLRLIDLEYNGDPDDDGKKVNPDEDLSIVLEFNDNLDTADMKKWSTEAFALLKLDKKYHKGLAKDELEVTPTEIDRTSVVSENMIQLIFAAGSLRKNAEYKLVLESRIGINPELSEADAFTIKTAGLKCNPKGINLRKSRKEGVCACKYPYMGQTCHECQDDYHFNPKTKECILYETCLEDTCNGHGNCFVNNKTGQVGCTCDPGFTDDEDGSHCARCVNENQVFPQCTLKTKAGLKSSN